MADDPTDDEQLAALRTALDQAADLFDGVDAEDAARPTACEGWTIAHLADHLVDGVAGFANRLRAAGPETPGHDDGRDWGAQLRARGDELLHAWNETELDSAPIGPDWQCAELSVHTWDLADALGEPTARLDPVPAERGLAFMRANLTDNLRGQAFGPAREAPLDADAYQRIAAFAGRRV